MNRTTIIAAAATLAIGLAGGYWLARSIHSSHTPPLPPGERRGEEASARQPLFYRHPMNPAVTSPVPKKDEMGMDYVPVYDEARESGPAGTVRIDPVTVQNIGVRTARAQPRALSTVIRAAGRVDYNEERIARLNPKTEGWVEALDVAVTGEQVRRDTILLSVYSPQLVTSQQEYLLALQNRETLKDSPYPDLRQGAEALVEAARARLELLDVPAHQIHELEQTKRVTKTLHIHSPFDGVIVEVGARPGQYVTPETELYRIADIGKVWVYADVYENELPWVRAGDAAEMRLASSPGRVFAGAVKYIYPLVDAATRTARLRLEFDNRRGELKPGMFAEVTLRARARESIAVPSEAVIRSGVREQVFVLRAPGKFEPRIVETGASAEGWTEIVRGVESGEEVVISAQFLIDSESKLREAVTKLSEPGSGPGTAAPEDLDMSGMEMQAPASAPRDSPRPPLPSGEGELEKSGSIGGHLHD